MSFQKTSSLLAETTNLDYGSIEQSINQYHMLGSIYEPGLVDTMLAQNPTVQLGWLGLSAAMAQAQIDLMPCGCSQDIYDFIKEMLFRRLQTRFQQVFIDTLQALLYGVAPAEVSLDWKGGRWWISDISSRPARGFDLFNLKKRSGEWWISGTYSWFATDGSQRIVECGAPWERGKALIFWPVFGPGLLGRSLLRPIVNEHLEKQQIRKLRGAALSKCLFGTPILHARQRREDEGPLNPEEVNAAKFALARASTGNATCLYLPDSFDNPDVLYAQTDGLAKSIEAENALDLQILMALGSSHLARGLLSGYGSQGAGENDQQLQDSIRSYLFQWFQQQVQSLIDYIVDLNFGVQEYYPEITITSPSVMSIPQLSRTLTQLVGAGLYRPCRQDEEVLRKLCRMPEQSGELLELESNPNQTGLGITGHYDSAMDTREGRDVYYSETKEEI